MRRQRVVGRIYGMKHGWKGHKDRNRIFLKVGMLGGFMLKTASEGVHGDRHLAKQPLFQFWCRRLLQLRPKGPKFQLTKPEARRISWKPSARDSNQRVCVYHLLTRWPYMPNEPAGVIHLLTNVSSAWRFSVTGNKTNQPQLWLKAHWP